MQAIQESGDTVEEQGSGHSGHGAIDGTHKKQTACNNV